MLGLYAYNIGFLRRLHSTLEISDWLILLMISLGIVLFGLLRGLPFKLFKNELPVLNLDLWRTVAAFTAFHRPIYWIVDSDFVFFWNVIVIAYLRSVGPAYFRLYLYVIIIVFDRLLEINYSHVYI